MAANRLFGLLVIASLLAFAGSACGQGTTTGGMFGQRTLGGGGTSGANRTAFGQPGANRIEQNQQDAGQLQGNERFVRGARQPGEFVGSDQRDVSSTIFGSMAGNNTGGLSGLQNLISARGARNRGNLGGRGGGRQSQVMPSIGMELGFSPPNATTATRITEIERRLESMTQIRRLGRLTVTIEDRTATIRGAVATDRDRVLVGHLVKLEPGVSQIRNEIVVGQPPVLENEESPDSPSDLSSPGLTTPAAPTVAAPTVVDPAIPAEVDPAVP